MAVQAGGWASGWQNTSIIINRLKYLQRIYVLVIIDGRMEMKNFFRRILRIPQKIEEIFDFKNKKLDIVVTKLNQIEKNNNLVNDKISMLLGQQEEMQNKFLEYSNLFLNRKEISLEDINNIKTDIILSVEMKSKINLLNTDIKRQLWNLAGIQTAEYVSNNLIKAKTFSTPKELMLFALSQAGLGLFLEFGVFSGKTINLISSEKEDKLIYGFDSFLGLPETWRAGFEKGMFGREDLPIVNKNVVLIKGWFNDTLPQFLKVNTEKCAFIHIDCDLYSSTETVFNYLAPRINTGTIILFDEYFNYPGWQKNEHKAFLEYTQRNNVKYEYIGYVENYEQVAVKIL